MPLHLRNSLALLLGLTLLPAGPASAGMDRLILTPSQASVLVTGASVVMVVSGPAYAAVVGARSASRASGRALDRASADAGDKQASLPPMRVRQIEHTADGGRALHLQDPQNPDNLALLQWPARADDPTAGFAVDQLIAFQPSAEDTGWLLHDAAGNGPALAFVPAIEAASSQHSQAL
jgi:hypothetical protein